MLFKLIPKKFGGCQVVSFHTLLPREGEPSYVGVAVLQSVPDLFFIVVLLGSDSVDSDTWHRLKDPVTAISWDQAQSILQSYIQGGPR